MKKPNINHGGSASRESNGGCIKNLNYSNWITHRIHYWNQGFSLVELMVVLAVVATLSVSAVLGFGYLGELLRARETAGFITDVVKREELKILRGDFDRTVIHFFADFLVIESSKDEYGAELSVGDPCTDGRYLVYGQDGNLTKRDENNVVLEIKGVDAGQDCIEFVPSEEREWAYQLTTSGSSSPVVRFAHFNVQRESESEPMEIFQNDEPPLSPLRAELSAPYAKKRFFDDLGNELEQLDLTVQDPSGRSSAEITIL